MDVLREILESIESHGPQPVEELLRQVLRTSRELTGAEAGTVFIVRGRGDRRRLEAASVQNDAVPVSAANLVVPITMTSIAGYTAATGETVFVDDLYAIPSTVPYRFDRSFDEANGYRSRSMLSFPLLNYARHVIGVVQLINRCVNGLGRPAPFEPAQADLIVPVSHIVGSAIERADMLDRIRGQNVRLRERNRQLKAQRERIAALQDETEEAFQVSIRLLAKAAEIHDENTAHHVERVNEYSYFLASELGRPRAFCDVLRYSAQLHDVGKMSVNVAVLRKQGPLDDDERDEMMRHPVYGWEILSASDRLGMAAEIALNHHERWDGTGYPSGLAGEAIPLSARIVALADVYDALRSERPYKPAFDHDHARRVLLEGDARLDPHSHFDPTLLDLFADRHEGFAEVYERLAG